MLIDPTAWDLDPNPGAHRDPHIHDDPRGVEWLWIILPVIISYALVFGFGYWIGGW